MKKTRSFRAVCLAAALLFCAVFPVPAAAGTLETGPVRSDEAFLPEEYAFFAESYEQALESAAAIGGSLTGYQHGIGTLTLPGASDRRSQSFSRDITLYPEYEYIVEQSDFPMPAAGDGLLSQWHLPLLHASDAWSSTIGTDILVAVVDTGIDSSHEDLAEGIFGAETTVPANYYGEWEMFPPEYRGTQDNLGHGTHVAGILGARQNAFGCTGIAPDCQIFSVKALERSGSQGRGRSSWVAAAINLAVEQGADIINLSVGGTTVKDELLLTSVQKALDAGICVVCAAGNTSSPVLIYPGAYEGTVSVSALKPQGDLVTFASGYSNSGNWIDFSAPGSNILSTVPGGYELKTGTSMACPILSGALALLFSADPLLTTEQAYRILQESALDLGDPGKDDRYGHGMPDLQAAVSLHRQKLQPDIPAAAIPSGATLFRNTPISLSTDTLRGQVVYTLDGTEPTADSSLWSGSSMTFPEDTPQLTITARTLSSDGMLGESIRLSYTFIPTVTDLTEDSADISGVIPGYAVYSDPVLNLPCRRYRIRIPADQELLLALPAELTGLQLALFAGEEADATRLQLTKTQEGLRWQNRSESETTVILSVLSADPLQTPRDIAYSFRLTCRESRPEITPEESAPAPSTPKPTEPKPTQPKPTQPKPPQPTQPRPTQPSVPPSDPVQDDTVSDPEVTFPDYEDDWLYAMETTGETATEIPGTTEATVPAAVVREEGENPPMENLNLQFLLAGSIILLFGIGLSLLGFFTGRKSWLLIRDGVTTTATVLRVVRCTDSRTYQYQMSYQTKSGQPITAYWHEYPRVRFARKHPEGSRLTIKYLPESPKQFMVVSKPIAALSSAVCLVIGVGVIGLSLAIIALMFRI